MNIFSLTAHWKRVKYLFACFQKGTSPKKRDAFLFAHETNSIYMQSRISLCNSKSNIKQIKMYAILLVLKRKAWVSIKLNIRFCAMYITLYIRWKRKKNKAMDSAGIARTKATSLERWKASYRLGVFFKKQQTRGKHLLILHKYFNKIDSQVALRKQLLWLKNSACKMLICMSWKRAFVIRFLVVFVLNIVLEGTNALCVMRSDVDAFSNPGAATCSRVGCSQVRGANGCKDRKCCMCQCSRNRPHYLIHRKACVPNDELGGKDC